MKKTLCYAMVGALLCSCGGNKDVNVDTNIDEVKTEVKEHEAAIADTAAVKEPHKKSLNDIRFDGWTEKEWLDNEYIRTLRRYLDDYSQGKIEDGALEPYRELTKSKFVVGQIEPFLLGGVFIYVMFVDEPEKVFAVTVYSEVNSKTEEILNYEVRSINYRSEVEGMPKAMLQQLIKDHPEQKVW
jgi:hypothetical protein